MLPIAFVLAVADVPFTAGRDRGDGPFPAPLGKPLAFNLFAINHFGRHFAVR